jgi:hypothetical protein
MYPIHFSDLVSDAVFFWLFSSWAGRRSRDPAYSQTRTHTSTHTQTKGFYQVRAAVHIQALTHPLFFSLKSLIEHLKPVGAAKLEESRAITPTNQNPHIALFLSSQNAEDGRILDAEDSMLGQPPSVCVTSPLPAQRKKSHQDQGSEDIEVEQDLDVALKHVYREVQEENIEGCVLEERLDEKDVALMDGASVSVIFSWLVTVLYILFFLVYFINVFSQLSS